MSETTAKISSRQSELDLPRWSLVSFDACEASGLTFGEAAEMMTAKEAEGVYGLCIVTDEAAARLVDLKS